jgi:hypothetical protein
MIVPVIVSHVIAPFGAYNKQPADDYHTMISNILLYGTTTVLYGTTVLTIPLPYSTVPGVPGTILY